MREYALRRAQLRADAQAVLQNQGCRCLTAAYSFCWAVARFICATITSAAFCNILMQCATLSIALHADNLFLDSGPIFVTHYISL
jgi:hypothetical protein